MKNVTVKARNVNARAFERKRRMSGLPRMAGLPLPQPQPEFKSRG